MNASGRRQRQAKNNFGHLAPRQRPNYRKRTAEASAKREAAARVTRLRIAQGSKKKK